MSDYSDRLDRIRASRDKCYAGTDVIDSLPQLHKDCYWLLEIVDQRDIYIHELTKERAMVELAAGIKMKHVMS